MAKKLRMVSADDFRTLAKDQKTDDVGVRKGWTCSEIRTIDQEARIVDFIISTDSIDRMGDSVSVDGWLLKAFKKNPVILFGHDHSSPPVARALNVKVEEIGKKKALVSRAEFMSQEISPFAYSIFQMYVHGFMRATSVGFIPTKWEFAQDEKRPFGINFVEQELIEYSAVPVPANPEALVDARGKGIDTGPLKLWAEEVLDTYEVHKDSGLIIPRKRIEQMRKHADTQSRSVHQIPLTTQQRILKENLERLEQQKQTIEEVEEAGLIAPMVELRAVGWSTAHPKGSPLAPAGDEIKAVDGVTDTIALSASALTDDDHYLLIHHDLDGTNRTNLKALIECTMMLAGMDLDEDTAKGVQEHLSGHYKEFEIVAPWDVDKNAWDALTIAITDKNSEEIENQIPLVFPKEIAEDLIAGLTRTTEEIIPEPAASESAQDSKADEPDEDEEEDEEDDDEEEEDEDKADDSDEEDEDEDEEEDEEEEESLDIYEEYLEDDPVDDKDAEDDKSSDTQSARDALNTLVEFMDNLLEDDHEAEIIKLIGTKAGNRLVRAVLENIKELELMLSKGFTPDKGVANEDDYIVDFDHDEDTKSIDLVELDEEDLAEMIKSTLPEILNATIAKLTGKVD